MTVLTHTFTSDQLDAIAEALSYHYLVDLSSYGVPEGELSEDERELRAMLLSVQDKLASA